MKFTLRQYNMILKLVQWAAAAAEGEYMEMREDRCEWADAVKADDWQLDDWPRQAELEKLRHRLAELKDLEDKMEGAEF